MKKIMMTVSGILMAAALSPAFAQQTPPAQAQVSAVAPSAPAKKKRTSVKKSKPVKATAAEAPKAAVRPQVSTATPAAELPVPHVAVATAAPSAAPSASTESVKPAAAPEAVKPAFPVSSCPHCFQPLLTGYNAIAANLKPWMEEMDAKAAAHDRRLSAIQKQINENETAIEQAKLGADKKAAKAEVKNLTKEHKALLKAYSAASDQKDAFYKKFAKEVEKRTEGYSKLLELKLKETLSAASD